MGVLVAAFALAYLSWTLFGTPPDLPGVLFAACGFLATAVAIWLTRRDLAKQQRESASLAGQLSEAISRFDDMILTQLRAQHVAIIELGEQKPNLARVWPKGPAAAATEEQRYANVVITHQENAYVTRNLTDDALRATFHFLFRSPEIRDTWRLTRELRHATSTKPRARAFGRIVNEVYSELLFEAPGDGNTA